MPSLKNASAIACLSLAACAAPKLTIQQRPLEVDPKQVLEIPQLPWGSELRLEDQDGNQRLVSSSWKSVMIRHDGEDLHVQLGDENFSARAVTLLTLQEPSALSSSRFSPEDCESLAAGAVNVLVRSLAASGSSDNF